MRCLLPLLLLLASCASVPSPGSEATYTWAAFDSRRILASGSSGYADRARQRALTIDDPVRIASISKLVVALGATRLVEEGKLDLDADVSDRLGWGLRNPAFADEKITLRMLLSHTSSLVDEIDYAIPLGQTVQGALSNEKAFARSHRPGTYFQYSNLNYPVIASVMETVTGERFDGLMQRVVLAPLGLDACFNWTTCSDAAVGRAVVLYEPSGKVIRDDLGGKRPACPVLAPEGVPCNLATYQPGSNGALFSPQGGLRVSARDLAVIGQLLLNKGRHRGAAFLSEASFNELVRPLWRFGGDNGKTEDGFYCGYGLAVHHLPNSTCRDDLFSDGRAAYGHAGEAYGVRSGLWVDPETGRGIAYFATSLGDTPPAGRTSFRAIEEWLARKLGR